MKKPATRAEKDHMSRVADLGKWLRPYKDKPAQTRLERFWSYVNRKSENECWTWIGGVNGAGYGEFKVGGHQVKAHRISWQIANGEINDGDFKGTMCICHKCDNRLCVNPSHLFQGTHQENMEDRNKKNRQARHKGELNGMSKLTAKKVKIIREMAKKAPQVKVSEVCNVSTQQVSRIVNRKCWDHV